jgi:hypothetical protein
MAIRRPFCVGYRADRWGVGPRTGVGTRGASTVSAKQFAAPGATSLRWIVSVPGKAATAAVLPSGSRQPLQFVYHGRCGDVLVEPGVCGADLRSLLPREPLRASRAEPIHRLSHERHAQLTSSLQPRGGVRATTSSRWAAQAKRHAFADADLGRRSSRRGSSSTPPRSG